MEQQFKKLYSSIRKIGAMQLPLYGANAAFFLTLSVFPGLLLILSALPYTGFSAVDLISALEGILPRALMGSAERLIVNAYYNSSGALVSVSALAALWSAARGIQGLMRGLNRVCGVRETRSWLHTRLICAGYVFVFLILLLVTLGFHVFGNRIILLLESAQTPISSRISQLIDLRLILLMGAQILLFGLMYTVLPSRKSHFLTNLPGAALAALGWQIFSQLFSLYVSCNIAYTNIYGSVYLMALGMLWLYCCMQILLFGAGLNRLPIWKEKG